MSAPAAAADRNLLFGILALQLDFIGRDQLVAAMNAWVLDKQKPLGEVLREQKALDGPNHDLLEALVQRHLAMHENDPQKSLAAVSSLRSVRQDLEGLEDGDVQASLANVGPVSNRPGADALPGVDPAPEPVGNRLHNEEGTLPSAGESTSAGTRFRILRPHAKGGLGQVYVALDEELRRQVALKEIQEQYAHHPANRARFLLEAEVTGGLEHPGIVPVYGLGTYADGRPFYAMRFIRGDSLKDALARFHRRASVPLARPGSDDAPLAEPSASSASLERASGTLTLRLEGERLVEFRKLLGRFVDVCQAIAYAHSRGILHRDLKPGNIMLGKFGETLVVDWGLAKTIGNSPSTPHQPESASSPDTSEPPLRPSFASAETVAGSALGTPAYMSPEQAQGRLDLLGPASDVYSLGATLYHLLTGKPPFTGTDVGSILAKVTRGEFPSPRQTDSTIPPGLEAICLKAMALRLQDRYASPKDLADDVEHWLADEPVSAWREPWTVKARRWVGRHRVLVTGAAAALLVGVISLTVGLALLGQANQDLAQAYGTVKKSEEETKQANVDLEVSRTGALLLAKKESETARKEREASTRALNLAKKESETARKETEARTRAEEALAVNTLLLARAKWDEGNAVLANELLEDVPREYRTKLWGLLKRQFEGSPGTLRGHSGEILSVALSADGSLLASGSSDRTIKIWDVKNGTELRTLTGHKSWVQSVALSADGSLLASSGFDQAVKVWDVKTGKELGPLRSSTSYGLSVALSADGSLVASDSFGCTVQVWDTKSGNVLRNLKGHKDDVMTVALSADGSVLASGSADKTVKLWDVRMGTELCTLIGHTDVIRSVSLSADGSLLASGSSDQTIKLWNAQTGTELRTMHGHTDRVESVALSPDGSRLASGSSDLTVKLWDAKSGLELRSMTGHTSNKELPTPPGRTPSVLSVALCSNGTLLTSGSSDSTIKLWDAKGGTELRTMAGHTGWVQSIALSKDGSLLASGGEDNTVKVWDILRGAELRTLIGHNGLVWNVALSADGSVLASGGADKTVKLWDVKKGTELHTLIGHSDVVRSVALSADGFLLASGSADKTVKLWDVKTGTELRTLTGHTNLVQTVALSADGSLLASGGFDQTVKLWDVKSGTELHTFRGHKLSVLGVALSADGSLLASGSSDQTVKLWDVKGSCQFCAQGSR